MTDADERSRRIGLNEGIFRDLNEELEQLAGETLAVATPLDLVCECGDRLCGDRIRVPRERYERTRADATLFLVSPGHVIPDVEDVVEEAKAYDVVRKHEGLAAAVAEATDPRS